MKLLFLIETNSWTSGRKVVAACTSAEKAVKLMEEWLSDEKERIGRTETIEVEFEKDGESSFAEIRSKESNAFESLDIFEAWTDDWLNSY